MRYEQRAENCWYDVGTNAFLAALPPGAEPADVDVTPLLASKKRAAIGELNGVCEMRITGGVTLSVLGAPHRYDTELHDQLNMLGLLQNGVQQYDFPCADANSVKADRSHTAAQLREIRDAFILFKGELLKITRIAKAAVDAASTAEGVQTALSNGLTAIAAVSDGSAT